MRAPIINMCIRAFLQINWLSTWSATFRKANWRSRTSVTANSFIYNVNNVIDCLTSLTRNVLHSAMSKCQRLTFDRERRLAPRVSEQLTISKTSGFLIPFGLFDFIENSERNMGRSLRRAEVFFRVMATVAAVMPLKVMGYV